MNRFIKYIESNYQYIFGGATIIFLILFIIFNQRKEIKLSKDGVSTICKVYYSAWLLGEGRYICKYYYFVENIKYYGVEIHYNRNCFIGNYYLVTYLPVEPSSNIINLNKEILEKDIGKYFSFGHNPFEAESKQENIKDFR
ncbi:MAG: hypothetical protein EHM93_19550 [Bacteroidales bacterium]|nr:MAG: hypothetical protein EHM93_19550 [Bacteroidales bacterium]